MDGFPSGQRGQTVNLLQIASVVRIHLHPFSCRYDGTGRYAGEALRNDTENASCQDCVFLSIITDRPVGRKQKEQRYIC